MRTRMRTRTSNVKGGCAFNGENNIIEGMFHECERAVISVHVRIISRIREDEPMTAS